MKDIQIDGTPIAAAAPVSSPRMRRRVMMSTRGVTSKRGGGRYGTYNMGRARQTEICERKIHVIIGLQERARAASLDFSLTFCRSRGLTPRLSRKDVLFDPPTGPLRPEVNARQRDAPSGAKVFGRSSWRSAPRHIGRHRPPCAQLRPGAGDPVAGSVHSTRGPGVLDTPPSRGMTGSK
jgi:signal recognition particle subunit SRP54